MCYRTAILANILIPERSPGSNRYTRPKAPDDVIFIADKMMSSCTLDHTKQHLQNCIKDLELHVTLPSCIVDLWSILDTEKHLVMAFLLSLHSEVKDPGLLDLISRLTSLLLQIEVSGCRGTGVPRRLSECFCVKSLFYWCLQHR